ncbi:hypothetical protein KCP77_01450 [Salmonella enterica subsp. enterica]|nr:hypothetical protein KCP77_01450 [Salmonella enterica subsp. enterica]
MVSLTPDKQHSDVVRHRTAADERRRRWAIHGFNIVEVGEQIVRHHRGDGGAEVSGHRGARRYKRGFGVPTLIAVHPENDPGRHGDCESTGCGSGPPCGRALESSFVAEVKST